MTDSATPAGATPAYRDKMAARFNTFDVDRSGVVTVEDFEAMAHRILDEYGLAHDSTKGSDLVQGARQFFRGLAELTDTSQDGVLTQEEFVTGSEQNLQGSVDGFTSIVRPFSTAVIHVSDTNDSGSVDYTEWARMLRAMGATESGATSWPPQLDTDGDGYITLDEVLSSAVSFYTGEQENDQFGHS